jgi:hypothetical protein
VKAGDPFRLQAILAPVVQSGSEPSLLLGVEFHGSARARRLEAFADRLHPLGEGEFSKQDVALVPGDHDDLARDVDLNAIESAGFHHGRAYNGGRCVELLQVEAT